MANPMTDDRYRLAFRRDLTASIESRRPLSRIDMDRISRAGELSGITSDDATGGLGEAIRGLYPRATGTGASGAREVGQAELSDEL